MRAVVAPVQVQVAVAVQAMAAVQVQGLALVQARALVRAWALASVTLGRGAVWALERWKVAVPGLLGCRHHHHKRPQQPTPSTTPRPRGALAERGAERFVMTGLLTCWVTKNAFLDVCVERERGVCECQD